MSLAGRWRAAAVGSVVAVAVVLTLSACTAGPNTASPVGPTGQVAGFWQGLWHGLIAPITFIVSLFNPDVGVYEVHNDGAWYTFGFLVGAMIVFSGGGSGASTRPRRRRVD